MLHTAIMKTPYCPYLSGSAHSHRCSSEKPKRNDNKVSWPGNRHVMEFSIKPILCVLVCWEDVNQWVFRKLEIIIFPLYIYFFILLMFFMLCLIERVYMLHCLKPPFFLILSVAAAPLFTTSFYWLSPPGLPPKKPSLLWLVSSPRLEQAWVNKFILF